jgi:very-short-patch-repair endonuclease
MPFDPGGDLLYQAVRPSDRLSKLIQLKRPTGLLTLSEIKAYRLISASIGSNYFVCCQVHLLQIFSFNSEKLDAMLAGRGMKGNAIAARKKQISKDWIDGGLGKKSVDFLVCDITNTKLIFAIEIDGDSHEDNGQLALDAMKDIIFASAGVPLLRISNKAVAKCASDAHSVDEFSKILTAAHDVWRSKVAELEASTHQPFNASGRVTYLK